MNPDIEKNNYINVEILDVWQVLANIVINMEAIEILFMKFVLEISSLAESLKVKTFVDFFLKKIKLLQKCKNR